MGQAQRHGWAVLNPAGYVVLSFPTAMQATRATRALCGIGLIGNAVRHLSDRQMRERLDDELERAATQVGQGEAIAVARDHRRRAERGCHWLVVRASNDGRACQVADCVRSLGVATARYYGHLVIQDLFDADPPALWAGRIDPASPALAAAGLDAERPSALHRAG